MRKRTLTLGGALLALLLASVLLATAVSGGSAAQGPTGGGVKDQRLLSPAPVDLLVAGGYTLALWSLEPRDWENPTTWPFRITLSYDEDA